MNARTLELLASAPLAACAGPMTSPAGPGATYEITIVRTWSDSTHPLDWPGIGAHFTCVPSLALKRDGKWTEGEIVTLYAWDSGTNNATTHKADKVAVKPFLPIALNDAPMVLQKGTRVAVGTATIRKISI